MRYNAIYFTFEIITKNYLSFKLQYYPHISVVNFIFTKKNYEKSRLEIIQPQK
jgi:hypothetical protein